MLEKERFDSESVKMRKISIYFSMWNGSTLKNNKTRYARTQHNV